ncbi:PTS glucose transporter subunit IIA [Lachnospiraceae bacterium 46-15]
MFKSLKGMFGGKSEEVHTLVSPAKGKAVPLSEVNDPTFADGLLGKGAAVIPSEGKIHAPADGTVEMMFETKHAVSLKTENGTEILVHVGLDTVNLKGKFYEAHVQAGDTVKAGDLLISFDIDQVKAEGYDVVTPVLVCNTDDYASVDAVTGNDVVPGDVIIKITK